MTEQELDGIREAITAVNNVQDKLVMLYVSDNVLIQMLIEPLMQQTADMDKALRRMAFAEVAK